MKEFALFDSLPVGVIVFEKSKPVFLSQHVLDVLNITYMSKKNALDILCKTLSLERQEQLFDFFATHDFFINYEKVIQINHSRDGMYDIFVFTHIFEPIISSNPLKEKVIAPKKQINEKVAEYFKLNKLERVQVLTFYKGLPLKNFAKILRISDEFIDLEVDQKHLLSLKERKEITIIYNEKRSSSVIVGEIFENKGTRFSIKNFRLTKEGMHQREGVRVKTNGALWIVIKKFKFEVYDISAKGISIFIRNPQEEEFLKQQRSAKLFIENIPAPISMEYLKTVYEEDQILKIIFTVHAMKESKKEIEKYLTNKQNEILREIHRSFNTV